MSLCLLPITPFKTPLSKSAHIKTLPRRNQNVIVNSFLVRPYTTRKGDTIETIATKRGFEVDELKKLNHGIDTKKLEEGITILVPAAQLSDRDREIIKGIGKYRTYPVRPGESLTDILEKRNISMEEFESLNPDVDAKKIKTNQVIKLPSGKYTVREQEMLMGTAKVPSEFFKTNGFMASAAVLGVAAIASIYAWYRERKNK